MVVCVCVTGESESVYHLEGLRQDHSVQPDDVRVVQGLHGGHFLEEVCQRVRLSGIAVPQRLDRHR